jgi:hypothetical protein
LTTLAGTSRFTTNSFNFHPTGSSIETTDKSSDDSSFYQLKQNNAGGLMLHEDGKPQRSQAEAPSMVASVCCQRGVGSGSRSRVWAVINSHQL